MAIFNSYVSLPEGRQSIHILQSLLSERTQRFQGKFAPVDPKQSVMWVCRKMSYVECRCFKIKSLSLQWTNILPVAVELGQFLVIFHSYLSLPEGSSKFEEITGTFHAVIKHGLKIFPATSMASSGIQGPAMLTYQPETFLVGGFNHLEK